MSSITFSGNKAIDANSLKTVIATQENSILPFSRSRYFDRPEFERDLKRIEAYYADHGYPRAKVTGVDVKEAAEFLLPSTAPHAREEPHNSPSPPKEATTAPARARR